MFKQDIFPLIQRRERKGKRGEIERVVWPRRGDSVFFWGVVVFVSVTTGRVIPFHSAVWLCPIMPACSLSACPPSGRREGLCWAWAEPIQPFIWPGQGKVLLLLQFVVATAGGVSRVLPRRLLTHTHTHTHMHTHRRTDTDSNTCIHTHKACVSE